MRYSFVLSGQIVGIKWLRIFNLSIENGIWWYFLLVTGASTMKIAFLPLSNFKRDFFHLLLLLYTENQFALHKCNVMWQWDFSNWLKVHKVNTCTAFSTLSSRWSRDCRSLHTWEQRHIAAMPYNEDKNRTDYDLRPRIGLNSNWPQLAFKNKKKIVFIQNGMGVQCAFF